MEGYSCVVADPPWLERGGGKIKRGADRHYSLMTEAEIIAFMQERLIHYGVAMDAHLYLWVTNTFLPSGLSVMQSVGFRYVTNICWAKPSQGIGQYFRGQHELCLFGVRGSGFAIRTADRGITSLLDVERKTANGKIVHSGKPDEFYERAERRTSGNRLELFGRAPRNGWTVDIHGTEAGS